MLTRLTVDLYTWIIEIYLWVVLVLSSFVGYHYAVPILGSVGLIVEGPQTGTKLVAALSFAIAAFLAAAVVTGPILVLFDIRRSIRSLEAKDNGSFGGWPQRTEHRELDRKEPT